MARLRPLIVPGLFALLMGAILIGLGVWQLHRLAWKEGLIAQIDERAKAAPRPAPDPSTWAALKSADYEYRHVAVEGAFDNEDEALVFRGTEDGPGYLVITPLTLKDGSKILVNRGFVPLDMKDRGKRMAGELKGSVQLTGLMRSPEPRNLFTPADDPSKGVFFTRDPGLIAAHFRLDKTAPFTIDADASPIPGGWPRGGMTVLVIPNNHLSYALTWFGLALALFGVFFTFAWRRITHDRAPRDPSHHAPSISLG